MAKNDLQSGYADLPDEVLQEMGGPGAFEDNTASQIDALAAVIAQKRDDAVQYRKLTGIEDTWMDCEEAYLGIDDENRHEYLGSHWAKPTTMQGPVTTGMRPNSSAAVKSTAFVKVTARYVDAGSAKLGEILLPIDDKAFSFGPSPVPELIEMKDMKQQVVKDGVPLMRDLKPGEQLPVGAPASPPVPGQPPAPPPTVPLTYADLAEEAMAKAEKSAKAAEKRIYDWQVQSQYASEARKVIFDSARIGTGVLKGPFPEPQKKHAVVKDEVTGKKKLVINEIINPSVRWVDPWNIYPDDTCGENIHHGSFIFERDYLSPRLVNDLKKNKAYLKQQLEKVLEMGPERSKVQDEREQQMDRRKVEEKRFEVWYFYGVLSRKDMECCGVADLDTLIPKDQEDVYAIVTMINNIIVRATINPLESGKFPYHVVPWRRRPGSWTGVGVAEQIRMPQRMINAATRALLVNAAKTAGSQIVVDRGCIEPADKSWKITPDKIWYKTNDAATDDVNKAFAVFEFPNVQKEMLGLIEYGFRLAEESCSIPLISQGQSGKSTPDTLGGQQLQDNNANQLLRSIGYAFDDFMTEPMVLQYYEWLLLDPNVPDEEKGDWNINAHGSASLVERSIQNQTIGNILGAALNPAYGADPFKTYSQYLRSQRLDPRDFQMEKEEFEKAKANPPPPSDVVQAAQIRAQATIEASKSRDALMEKRIVVDTDRDRAYVEAETQANTLKHQQAMEELKIRRELAILEYANKKEITLEQLRVELAKSTQVQQTKRDLAQAELEVAVSEGRHDRTHDRIKHVDDLTAGASQAAQDRSHEVAIAKSGPNSLVKDEMATEVTP